MIGAREDIVCLDHSGKARWARAGTHYRAWSAGPTIGLARESRSRTHLDVLRWSDGKLLHTTPVEGEILDWLPKKNWTLTQPRPGMLRAVAYKGTAVWDREIPGESGARIEGRLAADAATVFLARGASISAVRVHSGHVGWERRVGAPRKANRPLQQWLPFLSKGVLVVAYSGGLLALDSGTGRTLWRRRFWGAVETSGEEVLLVTERTEYLALDLRTGKVTKRAKVRAPAGLSRITSRIGISATHVWCADEAGRLLAIDRVSGGVAWCSPFKKTSFFAAWPVVCGPRLYINTYSFARLQGRALLCLRQDSPRRAQARSQSDA
jgi:outer membrane protein assembly factor BamB